MARRVRCETSRPSNGFWRFGSRRRDASADITRPADACADVTASVSCIFDFDRSCRLPLRVYSIGAAGSTGPASEFKSERARFNNVSREKCPRELVVTAVASSSRTCPPFAPLLRSFFSLFSAFFRSFRFASSHIAAILASFRRVSSFANRERVPPNLVLRASSGEKRAGFVRSGAHGAPAALDPRPGEKLGELISSLIPPFPFPALGFASGSESEEDAAAEDEDEEVPSDPRRVDPAPPRPWSTTTSSGRTRLAPPAPGAGLPDRAACCSTRLLLESTPRSVFRRKRSFTCSRSLGRCAHAVTPRSRTASPRFSTSWRMSDARYASLRACAAANPSDIVSGGVARRGGGGRGPPPLRARPSEKKRGRFIRPCDRLCGIGFAGLPNARTAGMGSAKIPKIDIRDLYGFLALESTQRKGRERMLAWHQHVSLCAPGK